MNKEELPKVPRGGSVYIDGVQYCDPTPVEMPVGYHVPESLEAMIGRMCTDRVMQMEMAKQNGGQDTEEEADDFEVRDGEELDFESSGYEMTEMQEEYVDLEQLRKDSEAHAEREVIERMEREKSSKSKRASRKVRTRQDDTKEDADYPSEEGTVNN